MGECSPSDGCWDMTVKNLNISCNATQVFGNKLIYIINDQRKNFRADLADFEVTISVT